MIENTNAESSSCLVPSEECYDENGNIKKEVYMRQFPDFNKHDRKKTKKKVFKFLTENVGCQYFRLEILGTQFGCVFRMPYKLTQSENEQEEFFNELWSAIDATVDTVKAFDFVTANNYDALEIWGIDKEDNALIMFLYVYDAGVIEIGVNN